MSLENWHSNNWLKKHITSKEEVQNLLGIVDRDLNDSNYRKVSPDWRFGIAYNAALKLCTVLLYAEGYTPERSLAHYRTIQSLPLILGDEHRDNATYLDVCRTKRNRAEYDYVGVASHDEADELIEFVNELKTIVIKWLTENHSGLL